MEFSVWTAAFGIRIKQHEADIDIFSQIYKAYVFDFVENTAIIIVIFIKDKTYFSDGTNIIEFLNKEGI
jgi:hypothetical protein